MKSFKLNIRKFLSVLVLTIFTTTLFAQNVRITTPSTEVVNAHLQSADAKLLLDNFTRLGYRSTGTIAEGTKSFQSTIETNAPVATVVAVQLVKEGSPTIDVTVSSENTNAAIEYSAVAEDSKTAYTVTAGKVTAAAKISINISKIIECYNKYLKGNTQSCATCFNCLKACIQNPANNTFWKKFVCCLQCNSCYPCITSIWKFLKCVF